MCHNKLLVVDVRLLNGQDTSSYLPRKRTARNHSVAGGNFIYCKSTTLSRRMVSIETFGIEIPPYTDLLTTDAGLAATTGCQLRDLGTSVNINVSGVNVNDFAYYCTILMKRIRKVTAIDAQDSVKSKQPKSTSAP